MACISPEGTLTERAISMLRALTAPRTLGDIAAREDLPLYRIRSSVRELVEADLVEVSNDQYRVTEKGLAKLG